MFQRAEGYAMEAGDWYLRDKRVKRRLSRVLRAAMIVFGVGGGLVPLLAAAGVESIGASWGYVLLAVAAGCAAFDRFFGLSAAWMRDIQGAQAAYHALAEFQLGWASLSRHDNLSARDVDERLRYISEFVSKISDIVARETSSWNVEFGAAGDDLVNQALTSYKR
jgi:hypothetical protein